VGVSDQPITKARRKKQEKKAISNFPGKFFSKKYAKTDANTSNKEDINFKF